MANSTTGRTAFFVTAFATAQAGGTGVRVGEPLPVGGGGARVTIADFAEQESMGTRLPLPVTGVRLERPSGLAPVGGGSNLHNDSLVHCDASGSHETEEVVLRARVDAAAAYPREDVIVEAAEAIARNICRRELLAEAGRIATRDSSTVKRAIAARALGYVKGWEKERLEYLQVALADSHAEVRDVAVAALAELPGEEVRSLLERALKAESEAFIRDAIEDALRDFGA